MASMVLGSARKSILDAWIQWLLEKGFTEDEVNEINEKIREELEKAEAELREAIR